MATKDYGQTYYPLNTASFDAAVDMEKLAESLEGRTVMSFVSTSARDSAFATLTAGQKTGALCHVAGKGLYWYDGSAWQPLEKIKYGYTTGTIEGNNMLRIPSAQCFFDGVAPTAIVAMNAGVTNYKPEWGLNDGAGVLLRIMRDDGVQLTSGNTAAVFWIAGR